MKTEERILVQRYPEYRIVPPNDPVFCNLRHVYSTKTSQHLKTGNFVWKTQQKKIPVGKWENDEPQQALKEQVENQSTVLERPEEESIEEESLTEEYIMADDIITPINEYKGYQGFEDVITLQDLCHMEDRESVFLVQDLVVAESINVIAGEGGCGKSSVLSQLCLSICCHSKEFLGYKIDAKHHRAIYLSTEDSLRQLKRRTDKQIKVFSHNPEWFKNLAFINKRLNAIERIGNLLEKHPADLVIIDNYNDLFEGDLNSSTDVRRFFNELQDLINKYDCTVIAITHLSKTRKSGTKDKTDILGSTAMADRPRHVLLLKRTGNDKIRVMQIEKSNYVPEELQKRPIYLEFQSESLTFNKSEKSNEEAPGHSDEGVECKSQYNVRPEKRTRKRRKSDWSMKRAYEMVKEEGKTQREAAKELGIHVSSVCRWLQKLKLSE